jgi:antitoxin StbD
MTCEGGKMKQILSSCSASISELKKNPTALLNEAEGSPIAILNHNIPTAYLIPADTYEWLMDKLEDLELAQIVIDRAHEKEKAIEVAIDDL